jgi:twitching motility protein PilT
MADFKSTAPAAKSDGKCVTGDLRNFNIFDITQSLMMSRKTALVTVQGGNKRGFIYFKDGQIVHALDDDLHTGEQAAFKIFYWRSGSFRIDFDAAPRERNVKLDTENLMLEIARHMDEAQRDGQIESATQDATTQVAEKFEDRFRNELHKVFNQVATQATPTRDRYTVRAFDGLLVALNDLSGTALFLRPDTRPRVKTAGGFETIKQEVVTATEIQGFLNALLSAKERERFHDDKEIAVYHSTPQAGTYQVAAFYDGGRPSCIFTPASKSIMPLARLGGDAARCADVLAKPSGLVLVTGPMPGGKSTFMASLLEESLKKHDHLVTLFSRAHMFAFSEESGFIIRADVTRCALGADGALQHAIEQGSNVIAIDEITNSEMFRDAVAIAAGSTLVVATLEADDLGEVADRIERLARGARSEKIFRQLSHALLAVVAVDLQVDATGGGSPVRLIPVPDENRAEIARGNAESLAFLRGLLPTAM